MGKRPQAAAGDRLEGHGRKSAAQREAVIVALLSARTLGQAAARAGVSERTIRRWLATDAEFQAEYTTARRTVFEAAIHRLQTLAEQAATTLEDLRGSEVQAAVRLGAARLIIEIGLREHDEDTILRRLDAIERAVQERTG